MRFPSLGCKLLIASLVCSGTVLAAAPNAFVLADPARDDYGDGTLKYPLTTDLRQGDLDLVEFAVQPADDGTWFVVTLRRDVRPPGPRVIDSLGRTEAQIARLGFYQFNVDVYIDTDRVEGSGQTSTLPGRRLLIDPRTAWEKVVGLSPQPDQSALIVRRMLTAEAKQAAREDKPRVEESDLQQATASAREALESDFWFARKVQVLGRRVRFFVPAEFLGGPASPDWAYTVVLTGATLEPRFDTTAVIGKAAPEDDHLLIPVGTGLSAKHFAGREDDPLQSPAVDVIVPAGQKQEEVLRDYDLRSGRMASLTGVVPGPQGKPD